MGHFMSEMGSLDSTIKLLQHTFLEKSLFYYIRPDLQLSRIAYVVATENLGCGGVENFRGVGVR